MNCLLCFLEVPHSFFCFTGEKKKNPAGEDLLPPNLETQTIVEVGPHCAVSPHSRRLFLHLSHSATVSSLPPVPPATSDLKSHIIIFFFLANPECLFSCSSACVNFRPVSMRQRKSCHGVSLHSPPPPFRSPCHRRPRFVCRDVTHCCYGYCKVARGVFFFVFLFILFFFTAASVTKRNKKLP